MENEHLSSGLEDYLEAIYIAYLDDTALKGAELARKLNISRASVSEALSKLAAKKYIDYSSYGLINLTEGGIREAAKIYRKHNLLRDFFEQILGVEKKVAEDNACRIEHIISQEILEQISLFMEFYASNPKLAFEYKKYKGL